MSEMVASTRLVILETLVKARKPMTLSAISKKLKIPPQKTSYHLSFLEEQGIIIKDGFDYFPQPLLVDDELRDFCAQKLSEIIEAFSLLDSQIVVGVGQQPEDVIVNVMHALVQLELPQNGD
ncbi:MAG TPA: winged helix-turn-helix domain-containing protein [Smithellaceae bacterium]|nr:winged helix-turn-helix domain-containing protein [Smithellaceae bacterium]